MRRITAEYPIKENAGIEVDLLEPEKESKSEEETEQDYHTRCETPPNVYIIGKGKNIRVGISPDDHVHILGTYSEKDLDYGPSMLMLRGLDGTVLIPKKADGLTKVVLCTDNFGQITGDIAFPKTIVRSESGSIQLNVQTPLDLDLVLDTAGSETVNSSHHYEGKEGKAAGAYLIHDRDNIKGLIKFSSNEGIIRIHYQQTNNNPQ